jgi:hypothetical protein
MQAEKWLDGAKKDVDRQDVTVTTVGGTSTTNTAAPLASYRMR